MWTILEEKNIYKCLRKVPVEMRKRYEVWKRIVELNGPGGLRELRGFHDEALKGEWQGCRSSRLNLKWRVIYQVRKGVCEVCVIDVNLHKY